ncbi:MAG: hypothetical protein ACRD0P_08500 [Stackebrandtia sp.]
MTAIAETSVERGGAMRRLWERVARSSARNQARERQQWEESLLTKAAGVSSTTLICHKDTWDFIQLYAEDVDGWHSPAEADIGLHSPFLLEIRLSGPKLVHILVAMGEAAGVTIGRGRSAPLNGDRAIAFLVYASFADIVDDVDPTGRGELPVPSIVIDNQIASRTPHPTRDACRTP